MPPRPTFRDSACGSLPKLPRITFEVDVAALRTHDWRPSMDQLTRITLDPAVMGGKACIRGLRVTVGTIVGLLAAGRSREEILKAYPYLEPEDIDQALTYAAWRLEEREVALSGV